MFVIVDWFGFGWTVLSTADGMDVPIVGGFVEFFGGAETKSVALAVGDVPNRVTNFGLRLVPLSNFNKS